MTKHQQKLDLLRGLAAVMVLFAHAIQIFIERLVGSSHPIAMIGSTAARHAVLIFFLLSGYLITTSIVANVGRNGRLDVIEYLSARVARIYPPLIGAICVVLIAWAIIHGLGLPGSVRYGQPADLYPAREAFTIRLADVPLALLMQNGLLDADGPLWTLYIEFHIYIVAMFFALAWSGRRLWTAAGVVLLALWTWRDPLFAFFAIVWVFGSAAALLQGRLFRVPAWPSLSLLACLIVLGGTTPAWLMIGSSAPWLEQSVQLIFCVVYADAIFFRSWTFAPAALVKTADFSYSLYVIHFPLLLLGLSLTQEWMGPSMLKSVLGAGGSALASLLLAWAFAKYFEDQSRFKPAARKLLTAALSLPLKSFATKP
jgi:peptidoglycan/LPS O-acetylase OafA/YrhL